MLRKFLTLAGFVISAFFIVVAFFIVCATNLVLNGYHRECGIWENAIPFACSLAQTQPKSRDAVRYEGPSPRQTAAKPSQKPAALPRPTAQRGRCAPLQQEPYRVQCDQRTGICYHDMGYRANCGLADNWDPSR